MNNSFNDEVFSLLQFNAMPASWEHEMRIWCGNHEILPLRELKSNLESHVTKKLAQERFALAKGTPESKETQNERALVSTAPVSSAQALVGTSSNTGRSCPYCTRSSHTMATCRVLVRHILNGEVKPNTVLPANFKMPSTAPLGPRPMTMVTVSTRTHAAITATVTAADAPTASVSTAKETATLVVGIAKVTPAITTTATDIKAMVATSTTATTTATTATISKRTSATISLATTPP
jgi:hypothetical protein